MADTELVNLTNNAAPASTLLVYLTDGSGTLDYKATLANLAASAAFTDNYVLKSLLDVVGDLYVASADNTPARLAKGSQGQHLITDTAETLDLKWVSAVDRQTFTGSGTWTKPLNVSATSMTYIRCIGGGGGGGGGRVAAAGAAHGGGGGGAAGGYSELWVPTSLLGATETVTIGAGGAGGAGGVQPTNDGTVGANGANTTFGAWVLGGLGGGGAFGTTAAGDKGYANATTQPCVMRAAVPGFFGPNQAGNDGGTGGVGAGFAAPPGGFSISGATNPQGNLNPGGGGGGGGITSGGAVEAGQTGGAGTIHTALPGAGGSGATAGGAGSASPANCGGGGGGGSGSRVGATGAVGGAGGNYGAGGGGGGATSGAFNAGAGGAGKTGYCEAVTWL